MSTENQNNIPEEIDLGVLLQKINAFFSNIALSIFKFILFLKKNILLLAILTILGIGLGYYLDNEKKEYKSEVIVTPNMGGTDYLYSKIDLLSSKLSEDDKAFFKSIGIDAEKIVSIKIEPIIDIYNFINTNTAIATSAQNTQNFEMIKLLSESGDINKVIKDKLTSKNYPNHIITIVTSNTTSLKETVQPLLKYLNTDKYLNSILSISKSNTDLKIKKDEQTINQIDSLVNQITYNLNKNQKSSNLVYNNENNQINSLFETKNNLINEIAAQKIRQLNLEVFIKDISTTINIKDTKGINGKMKLILPVLFIFLFMFIKLFIGFYKKQEAKLKVN